MPDTAANDAGGFQNLLNFRDVAASINAFCHQDLLKPGLFYRSARPDETTEADRRRLVDHYRIKTIIDLRTTTEHLNAAKKHSAKAAIAQPAAVSVPDTLLAAPLRISEIHYEDINLNGRGFERSLVWQLSYLNLAKLAGLMLLGYRTEAISIIGREVLLPRGLVGLGIDTLEHSKAEIKQIFDIFADQEAWPVLIHCTQGKDRTGIIVLLVLLLCEVQTDALVYDYTKSEKELEPEKEERMEEITSIGLTEEFAKSPADFVPRIQRHLTEHYGGAQAYLKGIGISEQTLKQTRATLQEKT